MSDYRTPIPLTTTAAVIGSPRSNNNNNNMTPATTTSAASESYAQDHWARYGRLKAVDDAKNSFIEDILSRYDSVVRQCQALIDEQNAQAGNSISSSNNDATYQQQQAAYILYLQSLMDANPFIVAAVDGNSLLFNDAFIRDGEKGGRRAAVVLKDELTDWLPRSVDHAPSQFKIMVKVYADFKGLAGTFMRGGVIDNISTFGEFARGFNTLFDFVDIGGGDMNSKIVGE